MHLPLQALFERLKRQRRAQCFPPMPVIVGSPRSGTTLLRLMLDAHPELAIPPETGFLTMPLAPPPGELPAPWFAHALTHWPPTAPAWADFGLDSERYAERLANLQPFAPAEGFRLFYRMYAEKFGKPRWGDKTPLYGLHIPHLAALLPEAHFIHIVRDGRSAALSLRKQWFSPGESMGEQARYWCNNVSTIRAHGANAPHYIEVRFENLLQQTKNELQRLCTFLQLPFSSDMLNYHERSANRLQEHQSRVALDGQIIVSQARRLAQQSMTTHPPDLGRIDNWRAVLSQAEISDFEQVAGPLLAELGYPLQNTPLSDECRRTPEVPAHLRRGN